MYWAKNGGVSVSPEYFRFNYETHLVSRRGNYPAVVSPRPGRWVETWAGCPGWRWSSPRRSERPLPACRPTDETAHLGNHASILKSATLTRSMRVYSSLFSVCDHHHQIFSLSNRQSLRFSVRQYRRTIKIYDLFTPSRGMIETRFIFYVTLLFNIFYVCMCLRIISSILGIISILFCMNLLSWTWK